MIWWDERMYLADQLASQQATKTACVDNDTDGQELKVKKRKATIDLDDDYVRTIIVDAFEGHEGWTVEVVRDVENTIAPEASCSDFHWGEYERVDWEKVHQGDQIVSMYCVRKGLIRKAHLALNLKKWNAKHAGGRLSKATPETLLLTLDDIDYFEEAMSDVYEIRDMAPGSQKWIAKPSVTNQAIGICIFDTVDSLHQALEQHPDLQEWVLQRYIERPLLVRGKKFHIRAYVLCIGSLKCYVFSEMLALFASRSYPEDGRDLSNLAAHLTNTCRADEAQDESELVKLLSELPENLEGFKLEDAVSRIEQLHKDVFDIIGWCMAAVSSELTFFTLPNCFELFGFDLLVDDSWNVWLLEANAEPDFRQTGQRLQGIIKTLLSDALELVLESCLDGPSSTEKAEPSTGGHWVKVFDKDQRGVGVGSSGMHMHS